MVAVVELLPRPVVESLRPSAVTKVMTAGVAHARRDDIKVGTLLKELAA